MFRNRKLVLERETLRTLTRHQLSGVAGGANTRTAAWNDPCSSTELVSGVWMPCDDHPNDTLYASSLCR